MGFIDWHGTKKDHYADVLEFAQMRQEQEQRVIDEMAVRMLFSEGTGLQEYKSIDANGAMKRMVGTFREVSDLYTNILRKMDEQEWRIYLWEDLWIYTVAEYLDENMIPEDAAQKLLDVFIRKVFRFTDSLTGQEYYDQVKSSTRFRRFVSDAYELTEKSRIEYWKWLAEHTNPAEEGLEIVKLYESFVIDLTFYLFMSTHSVDRWPAKHGTDLKKLDLIKKQYKSGDIEKATLSRLRNPIDEDTENDIGVFIFRKVLVFSKTHYDASWNEEEMIEELYVKLQDSDNEDERINSIMPDDICAQIEDGILPVFPTPEISGINVDEKIHYMNHAILYRSRIDGNDIDFDVCRGTVYLTDRRMLFKGEGSADVMYQDILRVQNYGNLPHIIEFGTRKNAYYIQIPDSELAYSVLQMIVSPQKEAKTKEVDAPFTYEELVDKADIGACIFAFEYLLSGEMPVSIQKNAAILLQKLKGLEQTIIKYPERKGETDRFLNYYIPETIQVIMSYQHYIKVGINEDMLAKIQTKVINCVETMKSAIDKKISEIYQMATMNTVAQADALEKILGNDGFSKNKTKLIH